MVKVDKAEGSRSRQGLQIVRPGERIVHNVTGALAAQNVPRRQIVVNNAPRVELIDERVDLPPAC